jgi:hypothetical protein
MQHAKSSHPSSQEETPPKLSQEVSPTRVFTGRGFCVEVYRPPPTAVSYRLSPTVGWLSTIRPVTRWRGVPPATFAHGSAVTAVFLRPSSTYPNRPRSVVQRRDLRQRSHVGTAGCNRATQALRRWRASTSSGVDNHRAALDRGAVTAVQTPFPAEKRMVSLARLVINFFWGAGRVPAGHIALPKEAAWQRSGGR